tara:strand:+ start:3858 stop:4352 length:495 start_codon:yes stop_codon:yes gene_type:complete
MDVINTDYQTSLDIYNKYHQNTYNKAIHAACIPAIALSIRLFLDNVYISHNLNQPQYTFFNKLKWHLPVLLQNIYCCYYFSYGMFPGIIMITYFFFIELLAKFLIIPTGYKYKFARYLFFYGWSMQFIGHWIEGSRPALTDSISQAFISAPLFSMQYFFPNILK